MAAFAFATFWFYPQTPNLEGTWLSFGAFLISYSLVTGAMGGYLGFSLARDMGSRRVSYLKP